MAASHNGMFGALAGGCDSPPEARLRLLLLVCVSFTFSF